MMGFNKASCKDRVETILEYREKQDEILNHLINLENKVDALSEQVNELCTINQAASADLEHVVDYMLQVLQTQAAFNAIIGKDVIEPVIREPPEEQPAVQKPRRKMHTRYDPSYEYLNSVQFVDKHRGNEMGMFGRVRISTLDIHQKLCEYGLARMFNCGNGYAATDLGIKTGLLINNSNGHLVFRNGEETDRLFSMLFNNPIKSKAYINSIKGDAA